MKCRKPLTFFVITLLVFSALTSISCSRQPTVKRAHNIMEGYFKKYAREYPDSIIGKFPVSEIKILHMEEVHKGLVATYAILELKNGMAVQTRYTLVKKPFGWRTDAWENMGVAMGQAER